MMKNNIKNIIYPIAVSMLLAACKAPMATTVETRTKEDLPTNFNQEVNTSQPNSGLTPWKQFFTDPQLTVLIDTALKNNQDLMITLQQIEIARADVLYRSRRLAPVVGVGGGVGIRKVGRYTGEGAGNASTEMTAGKKVPEPLPNFAAGVDMDWEVDIWKKLRNEKDAATARFLGTVEGKNFVLSNLIAEVATSYYELLSLDNQLDLIHQYMELQKKALEVSKIQKEAAATTELAVKKFDAELSRSKATEYTLKQKIVEQENTLNRLLGRYPQPIERNKSSFMSIVPQTVYTGIPSELLSNRPDIKQAEYELQAAKLDVEAARKEFYPRLRISASLGLESFNPAYLVKIPESVAFNALAGLAAPLINKTAIQANFKTADVEQIKALYEYNKTILEAYISTTNLMSKIKNLDEYYKLKAHQAEALDQAIGVADLLFRNARADYLEVLMNQRDALDAKMELIEAKQQQLSTVVDIYKNLGGGWR